MCNVSVASVSGCFSPDVPYRLPPQGLPEKLPPALWLLFFLAEQFVHICPIVFIPCQFLSIFCHILSCGKCVCFATCAFRARRFSSFSSVFYSGPGGVARDTRRSAQDCPESWGQEIKRSEWQTLFDIWYVEYLFNVVCISLSLTIGDSPSCFVMFLFEAGFYKSKRVNKLCSSFLWDERWTSHPSCVHCKCEPQKSSKIWLFWSYVYNMFWLILSNFTTELQYIEWALFSSVLCILASPESSANMMRIISEDVLSVSSFAFH